MSVLIVAALAVLVPGAVQAKKPVDATTAIAASIADKDRPETDTTRDAARNPAQMLAFAGVRPGAKVGELLPGAGYYTRLLAKSVGAGGAVYVWLPATASPQMLARLGVGI